MAPVTDDERKLARAYNIGQTLSLYEPRLLEKIIRNNPKNEFVQGMKIGRDHRHYSVNIPRKDNTPEFRNGFEYGRSVIDQDPALLHKMLNGKGLGKQYRKGLEEARLEFEIRGIQERIRQEPKAPAKELRNDDMFKQGFNVGYRLAGRADFLVSSAMSENKRYAKLLEGMKAGAKQHVHDLGKLQQKDPRAKLFDDAPEAQAYLDTLASYRAMMMKDIQHKQIAAMDKTETFPGVPAPDWLRKKEPANKNGPEQPKDKNKAKGRDKDHDR